MTNYWYKDAIIYSLDVKSFIDSNGDGIGDLAGLMQGLDYLTCLGINCIWMLPFYPSPLEDAGYDITDYYNVDERIGSLQEFVRLAEQAKERGIRIMADLVVNHTSNQHPWFLEARADKHSRYRDYYIWLDEKPANDGPDIVFPGVQESNWAFDETAGAWYYHTFYSHQPDLNVSSPIVQKEIEEIIRFWLQMGVDGLRIDAVPHILRNKGPEKFDGDPHAFLRSLRKLTDEHGKGVVLMGEADTKPESYKAFFGESDQLHMLLNFYLNNHLYLALAQHSAAPLSRSLNVLLPHAGIRDQFANFVRNHDELDLEQLTEKERQQVFDAFAPEPDMRIYGRGIRRRLPPMLHNDQRRIKLVYSLLFSLPGTPVLRYGEEIGMGDMLSLKERNSIRTVMQWANKQNGGFSTAPPDQLVWPVISDGTYGFETVNVADQANKRDSLLNTVSNMISIRKSYRAFGAGEYDVIETDHPGVLVHIARRDASVAVVLHNFTGEAINLPVPLSADERRYFTEILSDHPYEKFNGSTDYIELRPYGYRWLYKWPLAMIIENNP
ncbi:alpha-amylase family protein [Chitinophaga filiformis]|uniref:alpha-amylase family protein n=1 Tax=Chitinophaga filiformis TaxID=104663 RepID=UPI001F3EBE1D|nr:alpha-amylase family protein [Chitinophaga filiformis]MCF6404632.1 alpha-amylase family protein [Chitinophaga filiformis]